MALVSPGIQEAFGRFGCAGAGQPDHGDHSQRGGQPRGRRSPPGRGRSGVRLLAVKCQSGLRDLPLSGEKEMYPGQGVA